jgi:uric acid transporter
VSVAAGVVLLLLALLPSTSVLVEPLPTLVLGGAGLVMSGMVAASGIRILVGVDNHGNRNTLFIAAMPIGIGTITLIAPKHPQWIHP